MSRKQVTIDGNEAVGIVAHKTNEVIAIYPITPSSNMGEHADEKSAKGEKNLWGIVPLVQEMQSEAGAAGAVHGALQTGALTTTFTASQGLLLMIPNMYKIAGELTPTVFHIAARTVATHCLSIFGDHSDVMSVRSTGWAQLASGSVQEVMDNALIAQAATLESRVPFLHFFDGFRTSHEISKIELLDDEVMRQMLPDELILAHRARAMSPDRPVIRGTAQNPDVFFQSREAANPFYLACPGIVQKTMDKFASLTGRQYHLFDYVGAPDAERVIVIMGSGAEVAHETVEYLMARGEKVGVLKVRLYRPFSIQHFVDALPKTVKVVAAMERTKEPGSAGDPLYLDVVNAFFEANGAGPRPKVIGGRYGLSSKEFTAAMVKGIFDEMAKPQPKTHFTVGIVDDVTHTSIDYDPEFSTEPDDVVRAVFFGLGSDGTVSANKNSIKIIAEGTPNYGQGYFVYDSRKAGTLTVSHLRFGPRPIRSSYLIDKANFVACHQFVFMEKYDVLSKLVEGGTFLLNAPFGPDEVWDKIPRSAQEQILKKKAKFYVIDAYEVARKTNMGVRINTIMQTCFFAISGVLPREEAIAKIKESIVHSYGKRGEEVVKMNFNAVDQAIANLHEVKYPNQVTSQITMRRPVPEEAPEFVQKVTSMIIAGRGDELPVSAFPVDGTYPTGTTQWERRNIAQEIPVWEPDLCIQCGKCAMVCPHAAIRIKVYEPQLLENAPPTFKSMGAKDKEFAGQKYTIQVAPEDCTGCRICVDVCPARSKTDTTFKALNMAPQLPLREPESKNWDFFKQIPEVDRLKIRTNLVRQAQMLQPLFEFSGACAGCGETPYLKLMTQLFGDRAVCANATGCSSIYGGNLPTTPYSFNAEGRGPTWNNSLFEDAAEFGLGFRLSIDTQAELARQLVKKFESVLGGELVEQILNAVQKDEADIYAQRERVAILKQKLAGINSAEAKQLLAIADMLVKKSVWIIGGDGWAYDIGFGGLDHVIASGRDVNLLVLDTEVYSNTGGQASKSTPRGAVAKFAWGGKPAGKKDLGLIAMSYGNVYVASVAFGAKDEHTLRAFLEAEAYDGPSLIIAYAHCIAHGIDMETGLQEQKAAVDSGHWLLYRYNPELANQGKIPLQLDSRSPKIPVQDYYYRETRFKMLTKSKPEEAKRLVELAQQDVEKRRRLYEYMASMPYEETPRQ
ncbi:MAG TPA: pyruvate:ferredoxin (flavodoxin) oxidoreductase [Acidobacteriota bacterium]|nr:pyruvate:ferredoxin (flavodoxin) oxidoreductase [Acidobacteriota bacterium]